MAVFTLAFLDGAALAFNEISDPPSLAHLTEAERGHFATLTTDRRRAEWSAGRAAAREALRAIAAPEVSILPDERGVPRLFGDGGHAFHVSISHGRRVAAASASHAAARCACLGIDVLDPEDEPRIAGIGPRFLTETERALVAQNPRVALLAWGAREAMAKATSTGMFAFALKHGAIAAVDWQTRRITPVLAGFELAFEPIPGDGLVVVAGISRDMAAWARGVAGLDPPVEKP